MKSAVRSTRAGPVPHVGTDSTRHDKTRCVVRVKSHEIDVFPIVAVAFVEIGEVKKRNFELNTVANSAAAAGRTRRHDDG